MFLSILTKSIDQWKTYQLKSEETSGEKDWFRWHRYIQWSKQGQWNEDLYILKFLGITHSMGNETPLCWRLVYWKMFKTLKLLKQAMGISVWKWLHQCICQLISKTQWVLLFQIIL